MTRTNLLDLDNAGLTALFATLGEKPFRAKQVAHWVHQRLADDIGAMTDLSKPLRDRLAATAEIRGPAVVSDTTASDGTRKWLLDVGAGNAVEMVYIPEDDRGTLCISSQAGCALDCAFCSTGKQGFNRNLTTAEIVGQLWHANRALIADGVSAPGRPKREPSPLGGGGDGVSAPGRPTREPSPLGGSGGRATAPWVSQGHAPVTNVVMMGMGEPLANFDNVVAALNVFIDDNAYGLSRRRVTLSTSGIVPAIDRLASACPVALAVSLHAPDDTLRDELVPINRKYPLRVLLAACKRYLEHAPRDFVTFEYVMLDGVNDSAAHARALARLVRAVPCKLNLIPWNPFPGAPFATSPRPRILAFQKTLMDAGLVTTIRKTRGEDIAAACGQLAGRVQDRTQRRVLRIRPAANPSIVH